MLTIKNRDHKYDLDGGHIYAAWHTKKFRPAITRFITEFFLFAAFIAAIVVIGLWRMQP